MYFKCLANVNRKDETEKTMENSMKERITESIALILAKIENMRAYEHENKSFEEGVRSLAMVLPLSIMLDNGIQKLSEASEFYISKYPNAVLEDISTYSLFVMLVDLGMSMEAASTVAIDIMNRF